MENKHHIKKPFIQDEWIVFPDTVYNDFSCELTTDGLCLADISLEECIKYCKNSKNCDNGFYIKTNNKSVCGPINNSNNKLTNPIYNIQNDLYHNMSKSKNWTFVSNIIYNFPPFDYNYVFYEDKLILNNLFYNSSMYVSNNKHLYFGENGTQFKIMTRTSSDIHSSSRYVIFGDKINFYNENTTLIPKKHFNDFYLTIQSKYNSSYFTILPFDKNKMGKPITYEDSFFLKYNDLEYCMVDSSNNLTSINSNISEPSAVFTFTNKMIGYKCEDDKCIADISNTVHSNKLYRNSECLGQCTTNKMYNIDINNISINNYIGILFFVIVISIITFIIHKSP
ncbi:MAG: hypothetical protein ACW98X_13210 [Promethearchaeota archaeon]|jgi:hypothetical protein